MNYQMRRLIIAKLIIIMVFFTITRQVFCESNLMTPLSSDKGRQLLLNTHLNQQYLKLSENYTTQKNQTYCGIASSVIVLNALKLKPQNLLFGEFNFIDQDNFFNEQVIKKISRDEILKRGLTLDQLGGALKTYPVDVSIVHAKNEGYAQFLRTLDEAFNKSEQYIIVNFLRTKLGQPGGGHFSPIAAYDKDSDKVLIMDVARYKYFPYWVSTRDLWNAMQTADSTTLITRGFLVIKKSNALHS